MFVGPSITFGFLVALALHCEGSVKLSRINRHLRIGVPPPPPADVSLKSNWFYQYLDHSRPSDTRTWKQLYFVAKDYYKEGGPVFIMIGGEGPAGPSGGAWEDYAKKYNAMMFVLEHRYYGQSHPTCNLTVENLKYLTSEQALADVANFIVGMNRQHKLPPDTKWVAFGGSYAGNLAAWVRYKYPHLVHAAVSSSGPVLVQVDFPEYMDVVRDSLGSYSRQCVKAIEDATKEISILLTTELGRKTITDKFRLCNLIDPNNRNDVATLLEILASPFAIAVQYNMGIEHYCDIMVNQTLGTPIDRYAAVSRPSECLNYKYETSINLYKDIHYEGLGAAGRAWIYQTCTEFGYYQTSENKTALFRDGFALDYYLQKCRDIFSKEFNKELIYQGAYRTNMLYGGLDIKATSVVYVHGSIDPWHALGITKTRIPESPAIFINGTTHCANMYSPTAGDPPALTAARQQISSLIGKWLQ